MEQKYPVVTIEMENGAIMKAELYPEIAPSTVNNFISLVKKGFYDGDYVLVRSQQEIEIGQIGIFGNNGDGFIKKLGKRDLISLNSNYEPIHITEETTCFGLVLGTTEIISK